ncbi:MAG TPA: serine hydrolase [Bryobacteraceae bacterium]|nr:serine hydrolase [Bryobacteraceae bacterium]
MKITLIAALALLGATSALPAAINVRRLDGSTISGTDIDATVTHLMAAAEVTGVGIAIINRGKIAYMKPYGFRDKDKRLPLTEDSVMDAASFTKSTFAYLVMQLVAEKVLDLDKPIQQYLPKPLPEYSAYQDLASDPRYQKITARMLLSHTSGFPNFRTINRDRKLNINFEPGSRYAYSGEGIQLLQLIVETVTHRPLQDLMRERIFQPFGMSRTSMVSEARFDSDLAIGYDEYGRSLGHPQRKTADAAGSMQTTLRDYTAFMQAVIESRGLRTQTRAGMLTPQIRIVSKHQFPTLEGLTTQDNNGIRLSYGLGWGLYWSPYGKAFFKEGHEDGFRNYTVVFDQSKDGIVVMTNSANAEGIFKDLLENLIRDTFTPIEWEGFTPYNQLPPRKPLPVHKEITLDSKQLDRLMGRYELSAQLVVNIVTKDGHLAWVENDEPPMDLFPETELEFFRKDADDAVTFETDSQGRSTRLVLHANGRNIPMNRVK